MTTVKLVCAMTVVLLLSAASFGDPAAAAGRAPPPDGARYEIVVKWVGYTGLAASKDCDAIANPQGYDSLVGIVGGIEQPPQPDEDMEYEGTVKRVTRLDYCITNAAPSGQPVAESGPKLMFANRLARLRDGAFYPAKPDSPLSLRVVKRLP